MAGGHNDGIAVGIGVAALFLLRRVDFRRGLLAAFLLGLAAGIKAPFALFGVGLSWAARRSLSTLMALAIGGAAILVPSYLLAGRAAISATAGLTTIAPSAYTPWLAAERLLNMHDVTISIAPLGLIGSAILAVILARRLPPARSDFPAVRLALAMSLALLIVSPQQRPWYDAMIFPLLAAFPTSRLDWIVVARALAGTVGGLPRFFYAGLHPSWLSATVRIGSAGIVPLALTAIAAALLWVCFTNDWGSSVGWDITQPGSATGGLTPRLHRRSGIGIHGSPLGFYRGRGTHRRSPADPGCAHHEGN